MSELCINMTETKFNKLKKILQNITTPKVEWSENREEYFNNIINYCVKNAKEGLKTMEEIFE